MSTVSACLHVPRCHCIQDTIVSNWSKYFSTFLIKSRRLNKRIGYSHRPVQTAYRYCVPRRIAGLLFSFVWADSLCMRMKEIKESRVHQPCAARAKKGHTKQAGRLWAHCKENRGTIIHWCNSPPSCCSFLASWVVSEWVKYMFWRNDRPEGP